MRIAHVANFYGPRSGGLRTTMHRLGHGYQQRGHEVLHIVPGAELEREWTESGQRLTIPGRVLAGSGGYRVIVNVARVRRLLEEFAPDALEVSDRFTLSSLGDWARDRGVPSAVFSHETLTGLSETFLRAPLLTNAPVNWWNHRLARRFDHVVATTAFAAREFQRLGVTNLVRVPLGVDLDVFHPARRDEVWRAAQLENGDDVLLVHCGRLSPEKKVDRSIDTLIAVAKNDGAVTQTKIHPGSAVTISDATAFGVIHKHSTLVTPVTIVLGDALGHVSMRLGHQLLLAYSGFAEILHGRCSIS